MVKVPRRVGRMNIGIDKGEMGMRESRCQILRARTLEEHS